MAQTDYFQAGVDLAKDWQQNNRTREDRELITQMNRLKANDIIKGMEVDAEVKNFLVYAEKDAKALDKTHPGYASQLMGIAKTRMSDLSPTAYERAVPMVRQFYDRFDARKQIEAEMDQQGVTTDYRARFGEDPTGISFPDAKFALEAKNKYNVDPVFAEKDGIRIFDRKGTEALVNGVAVKREQFKGELEGEGSVAKTEVVRDYNEKIDLAGSDVAVGKVIDAHFAKPIKTPDSIPQRQTILDFNKAFRHDPFPLKPDGLPDYAAAFKMIKDDKLATIKAVADAGRDPTKEPVDPKLTDSESNAAGFYKTMEFSESIINGLPAGSQPGAGSSVLGSIPLVGGASSRSVQSAETQKFVQASQAWVRAKLRKESGAAIGKDEMAQEIATYFPQVGDKPDVIAQKAAMRLEATNNMKISSGRALKGASAGSSSSKVVDGVLQAADMAAGQAFLKANPQADVKFLQINGKRYPVTRNP